MRQHQDSGRQVEGGMEIHRKGGSHDNSIGFPAALLASILGKKHRFSYWVFGMTTRTLAWEAIPGATPGLQKLCRSCQFSGPALSFGLAVMVIQRPTTRRSTPEERGAYQPVPGVSEALPCPGNL